MLIKVMRIKGDIHSVEADVITKTHRLSFGPNSQYKLPQGFVFRKNTVLQIDSAAPVKDARKDVQRFLTHLSTFVAMKAVEGAELEGSMMITVETPDDSITIRVTVKNSKVTYQEARLIWDAEEVVL